MLQAFCGLASICLTLIKLIPFFFLRFSILYIFVFNFLVVAAAVVVLFINKTKNSLYCIY